MIREAMVSTLAHSMKVVVEDDVKTVSIYILEAGKSKAHGPGVITVSAGPMIDEGRVWNVENVNAKKGYGPMLYDIAMEYVCSNGYFGIAPDSYETSQSASNVWRYYFENRSDVKKTPLQSFKSDRAEHLNYCYSKDSTPTLDSLENSQQIVYK